MADECTRYVNDCVQSLDEAILNIKDMKADAFLYKNENSVYGIMKKLTKDLDNQNKSENLNNLIAAFKGIKSDSDGVLAFIKNVNKMKFKGIFSRAAKVRDALLRAHKAYKKKLANELAINKKVSSLLDAGLKTAKDLFEKVSDCTTLEEMTVYTDEDEYDKTVIDDLVNKVYDTLCNLARLDPKLKKDDRGLQGWYNEYKGETNVDYRADAILGLEDYKGKTFGGSRVDKFWKIFSKNKLFCNGLYDIYSLEEL